MMNPTCTILDALQERFSRLPSQCSPEQPMFDAQGREYLVVYRTIPTSLDGKDGAIASNLPNFQLNKDYLQDFQARDLSAIGESSKIRKIAQKLDATRLLVASGDPTIGAPVVWTSPQGKSYVLGGNGRTIAFLLSSDDSYKNYVNEASQRWFNVYDTTERKGYRNLLVRDVYKVDGSPLSVAEAVKLAGASQESTAGKETPLRQALSRARGMGITKDTDLGQIVAPMALSPYTIDKFTKNNFGFFRKVMDLVPDYIRVQLTNIDDKTKPIAFDAISSVLVGRYLPVKFVQEGFGNDKEEEAIIGVLPSLVALQQAVDNGRIYPQYDLLDKLETARSFMKLYRWKSYGDALQDYQTQCELQTSFLEPSPVCAMNKLGVAFGLYLKRMVQSSDPTKGVSDINKYIDKALEDDPNMVGMFGEPTPQEIEDKATKAFISLALPSKLGETLLQQNPSEEIMDTDRIIIEALPTRFKEIASPTFEEDTSLKLKYLNKWSDILPNYLQIKDAPAPMRGYISFHVFPFKYKWTQAEKTGEYGIITHNTKDKTFDISTALHYGSHNEDEQGFKEGLEILSNIDPEEKKRREEGIEEAKKKKPLKLKFMDKDDAHEIRQLLKPVGDKYGYKYKVKVWSKGSTKGTVQIDPNVSYDVQFRGADGERYTNFVRDTIQTLIDNGYEYYQVRYSKDATLSNILKRLEDSVKSSKGSGGIGQWFNVQKIIEEPKSEPTRPVRPIQAPKRELVLKPQDKKPVFDVVTFDHTPSDGTYIEDLPSFDKDEYWRFVQLTGFKSWQTRGEITRPKVDARKNKGFPYPQQWFIDKWFRAARFLLQNGHDVYVIKDIDPRLDANYLLESEQDLDDLLEHMNRLQFGDEREYEYETQTVSSLLPKLSYAKIFASPEENFFTDRQLKEIRCSGYKKPIMTYEQLRPYLIKDSIEELLIKKQEVDLLSYDQKMGIVNSLKDIISKWNGVGQAKKISDLYISQNNAYLKASGYDLCKSVKVSNQDSGNRVPFKSSLYKAFVSPLANKKSTRGYPFLSVFPTRADLILFCELRVNDWLEEAKKAKDGILIKPINRTTTGNEGVPVSTFLYFQRFSDGSFVYFYLYQMFSIFWSCVTTVDDDVQYETSLGHMMPAPNKDIGFIKKTLKDIQTLGKGQIKKSGRKGKVIEYSDNPATAHLQKIFDELKSKYEKEIKAFLNNNFWKDKKKQKLTIKRPKGFFNLTEIGTVSIDIKHYYYSMSGRDLFDELLPRANPVKIFFPIFTNHRGMIEQTTGRGGLEPESIYVCSGWGRFPMFFDSSKGNFDNVPKSRLLGKMADPFDYEKSILELPIDKTAQNIYKFILQVLIGILKTDVWLATKKDHKGQVQ